MNEETVPCDTCGKPVDADDELLDGRHICAACYWGEESFACEEND